MNVSSSDSAVISKGSATTIGSTASMHAVYDVSYGLDPIVWGASYQMNSNIKFLQNDSVEDEIHITASYDFS